MPSQVLMLCLKEMDSNDKNLLKIITFLGLNSKPIFFDDLAYALNNLKERVQHEDVCAVINCRALYKVSEKRTIEELKEIFFSGNTSMLVYNISPSDNDAKVIGFLSEGRLRSISHLAGDALRYTVSNDDRCITRQFHGSSFGPINSRCDFIFNSISDHDDMLPLISIDDHPFFVRYGRFESEVFFVANNQIVDIDMKIVNPKKIRDVFSQIVPEAMFFKYIFGDNTWHTQRINANIMIDDPPLWKKYGFINYSLLFEEIEKDNICLSIPFIPFNYKRSDQETVCLFLERPERLSLCVHGSQHTNSEFGLNDINELNRKIALGTWRMDEHEKKTGVPYEKVMVFPQGVFSVNAMRQLKYHNYHAAVNTEAIPFNEDVDLTISACLEPAIMDYGQFPLFSRRYPVSIEDFAFDAFFGKPLLIAEHHTYFKHGFARLEELIGKIQNLDGDIRWDNLGNIVTQSYLVKKRSDGDIDIRMYANPIRVDNTSDSERIYYIKKAERDLALIEGIRIIGGEILISEVFSDTINIVVRVQPQTIAVLSIEYKNICSENTIFNRNIDPAKVIIRRYLSEMRDNFISKNHLFSFLADAGHKSLVRVRGLMHSKRLNY